jgi:hypothetical protein
MALLVFPSVAILDAPGNEGGLSKSGASPVEPDEAFGLAG